MRLVTIARVRKNGRAATLRIKLEPAVLDALGNTEELELTLIDNLLVVRPVENEWDSEAVMNAIEHLGSPMTPKLGEGAARAVEFVKEQGEASTADVMHNLELTYDSAIYSLRCARTAGLLTLEGTLWQTTEVLEELYAQEG